MPIRAEVEGLGVLEFPDGTDPAVIQMTVKRQLAKGSPQQRMDALYGGNAPPERNIMSSVAHGGLDIAEGAAQIASRGATALGLPPGSDYPFIASPDVVERNVNEARAKVDKALGHPNPQGFDLARIASGGVLASPLAGAVGTAPTMAGRALQAGRAGMVQGSLQPVEGAKDNLDFAKTKTFQAGVGGLFGAAAQPALEFGSQGVASLANAVTSRAKGAIKDTTEDAAAEIAGAILARNGVAINGLEDRVRNSIIQDVRDALKKYGGVDPKAVQRQADFRALDVDPLKPWVTRDPIEFGKYKNLEGAKDAGEPLIRAREDLDRKLLGRIESQRGQNAGDAYQAGSRAEGALAVKHAGEKAGIDALYDRFRKVAPNASADGKRMAEELFVELDDAMAGGYLSAQLRDHLNNMVMGKTPATPSVLYQLQKIASAESRKGGNEGFAAGKVVGAIDRELDRFADEMSVVGPEMKDAVETLKRARAAHRSLKMKEEAIPALRDVAEGKFAAEDFFNRYILGGDVKEVAAMWANTGGEVKQAARSQLVDFLKKKAAGAQDGAFKQDRFREALDSPGMPQKIRIILGEKGLAEIQRVQRAAEAAISLPAGTRYNTSGTAMELANLAGRGIPVIGPQVQSIAQQTMAGQMMRPGPSAIGQGVMDPFYEELLRKMRQGSGLLAPVIGGGVARDLSN